LLGGKILRTLEKGGLMIVDELDTSLHPFITKMIVMIFQSETTNPKNAQLIFTTHDVSLLDRDLIRRDQVWIAEKNEKGSTELYSLQDFDVREDTPFEKWYLAGKFGGLPKIKSIESLLLQEDEQTIS
jgi:AAA15 family ATPase/GTPase